MRTSPDGISIMQYFEQCKLAAYPDPLSHDGKPYTIGWGHTGPDVYIGLVWSQSKADSVFAENLHSYELGVSSWLKVPVTQYQFDALVSLAYNIGLAAIGASTLVRLLNAGDYAGAAGQFRRWCHGPDGSESHGLKRRREAERLRFLGADAHTATTKAAAL